MSWLYHLCYTTLNAYLTQRSYIYITYIFIHNLIMYNEFGDQIDR